MWGGEGGGSGNYQLTFGKSSCVKQMFEFNQKRKREYECNEHYLSQEKGKIKYIEEIYMIFY